MDVVQGQVAIDALRRSEAEQESRVGAPVVADQEDAVESERVEQGEDVRGKLLLLVAPRRCLGPAEPPQVGSEHPVSLRQAWHDMSPLVPVLWPAVEEHQR